MTGKISAVEMQTTLERYLERVRELDVDGVLELMAEDVSVEDPVLVEELQGQNQAGHVEF